MILVLALFACSGSSDDSSTPTDSVTDTDTGAACSVVNSGDWEWGGECPGMPTALTMTVDSCSLTLDYGNGGMTMGMPYAGTVAGTAVTFEDGDSVTGCTGTVVAADRIEGSCDGGCTFKLKQ